MLISFLILQSFSITNAVDSIPSGSKDETLLKIRELKDRVASKVSELRSKRISYYSGEVKKIDKNSFLLLTNEGEKNVTYQNSIKYLWVNNNGKVINLSINNLEVGDNISLRSESDDNGAIEATIIVGKYVTFNLTGTVSEITPDKKVIISLAAKDTTETTVTILTNEKTKIEKIKDAKVIEGTFKDINKKDVVLIRGTYKDIQKKEISAMRILIKSPNKKS